MIRGDSIGGGLLIALAADMRLAAAGSQFEAPAARLGLGYGFAGVEALAELVGPAWTAEILFSARRLDAAEALQIGLVNRVVPPERLDAEVMGLAQAIRDNAPLTIAACKAALGEARRPPHRRELDRVAALVEACFRSDDYREGQRAFAKKRHRDSSAGEAGCRGDSSPSRSRIRDALSKVSAIDPNTDPVRLSQPAGGFSRRLPFPRRPLRV